MTDPIRALCAELAAELDHNRRCLLDDASLTHPLADRARAALAEPVDAPATVAERPSDDELGLIYHDCCRGCEFMDQGGFEDAARAVLARWGRPAQPAPPAEGEVAELARWLRLRNPIDMEGEPDDCTYFKLTRAAELLAQAHSTPPAPVPVPVPVSDRPWERKGWCDMDGECWWCPPDGPAYWSMVNPAMVYGGWLLPHWAIHQPPSVPALPLPAPQGEEME